MSTYEKIANRLNDNGNFISGTVKISDANELRELANITPDVVSVIQKSGEPANEGSALTREVIIGNSDRLPNNTTADIVLSAGEDVKIADNTQWVLPENVSHSIMLGSLTLGAGASIKSVHSVLSLTVKNLKKEKVTKSTENLIGELKSNSAVNYDIGIFGSKGANGTAGADGNTGSKGADGQGGHVTGGSVISRHATDGKGGAQGGVGSNGTDGKNGNPSLSSILTFTEIDEGVTFISIATAPGEGGDGGNGGKGGTGGNGGNGGKGDVTGCVYVKGANGGDGGQGGAGGKGGNGGNGANGEPIVVKVPKKFNAKNVVVTRSSAEPGKRGNGGAAGNGGAGGAAGESGGKGSDNGQTGTHGALGTNGENGFDGKNSGIAGNVSIIHLSEPVENK